MNETKIIQAMKPGFDKTRDVMVVTGDTHIGRWVETEGRLTHDQFLPHLIADSFINRDSVVYDVGAFIGDHTCLYTSRKPRAVVAFEPFRDAFDCLRFNMSDYVNQTDVRLYRTALGNGERLDPRSFGSTEPNKGARHLTPTDPHLSGSEAARLDWLIQEDNLPPPTLIKLDIEGWEPMALSGMATTLIRHRPILVIEVNRGALARLGHSPGSIDVYLKAHNYIMTDIYTKLAFDPNDDRDQFDIVAKPW